MLAPGVLKTDSDWELVCEPQHGAPSYFNCKNGLGGRWGNRSRELFEGLHSKRTQELPKHHPARETWLAPIDAEGMDKLLPPTELSLEDFLRAVERNYIDDYPRTFTKIRPVVRWANPTFSLATQTVFYTTMKGKERAAATGEAALGCLRLHFITWTAPESARETEERLTSFLRGIRLEPVRLTLKQRDWICYPGGRCTP